MRNEEGKFSKEYEIDETFFQSIEQENQAYILGFLYADGCNQIYENTRYVSMCQLEQDKDILDKIKREMKFNNPDYVVEVQKSNNKIKYKLQIYSRKISKDLEKLGVTANKSLTLQFPTFIPDSLMPHFIRGYFDGDGCVWEGKPKIDSAGRYIHNVKFTFTGK